MQAHTQLSSEHVQVWKLHNCPENLHQDLIILISKEIFFLCLNFLQFTSLIVFILKSHYMKLHWHKF